MKKFYTLVLFVVIAATTKAQLKLSEQFANATFTASGSINGINGWSSSVQTTDLQVSYRTNNTGALVFAGYTSGNSSVNVSGAYGGTISAKNFNVASSASTVGTFFSSFVFNASAFTSTKGDYCFALQTSGAANRISRFYVRKTSASATMQFGIRIGGNVGTINWTTGTYSFNQTYLIVLREDINRGATGTGSDNMYLWVDPTLVSEPATASATLSQTGSVGYGGTESIAQAYLRAGSTFGTAQIDAIKVAYGSGQASVSANASAAWSNLGAQGAPLPVKLGTVSASARNNGVSVDWTALTELNLSKYIVERSADGMNFSAIGSVTAKNSLDATNYSFFDAAPAAGNNYYRLKSEDIDGKSTYSSIVKVNLDKTTAGFVVYPNPVRNGSVSFQSAELAKGNYTVKVISVSGQQMMAQSFTHNGGAISQSVQLPQSVKTGIYTLLIENAGTKVMNKSFIVQ